jgi:cytochrome c2
MGMTVSGKAALAFALISASVASLVSAKASAQEKGQVQVHANRKEWDLVAMEKEGAFAKLTKVQGQIKEEPAYKDPLVVEGYLLADVLRTLPDFPQKELEGQEIRFVATDGYEATMPLAKVFQGEGLVSFRDISQPSDKPWREFDFGKGKVTPAPFYLVWRDKSYRNDKAFVWPWMLAKIRVGTYTEFYGDAVPKNKKHQKGFDLFKQHCLSCHSVNLVGGLMGAEFNVPKSITEYRSFEFFESFARAPETYRARSRMGPHGYLKNADFKSIWSYLQSKSKEKICKTKESCSTEQLGQKSP